jgi:hypothetical protein
MKKIISFWIMFLLTIVSAEAAKEPRKFYLTKDGFTGAQALTACADGYHMATLWEIFDVTNLSYDTTLGFRFNGTDSEFGPTSGIRGWIRTGYAYSGQSQIAGQDNCFLWTSDSALDSGSTVLLNSFWAIPPAFPMDPWVSFLFTCDSTQLVWCVQD